MKPNLAAAIANRDAGALARMAQSSTPQKVVNPQAEQLVDVLFLNLKQIFPASVNTIFKNESDELAAKRQWIAAFAENGITTREQLQNGMRHARASDNPFWPAVGQFIKWCKQEDFTQLGLPTETELYEVFKKYCSERGWRRFNWPSNACYWIVTKVYSEMRSRNLSDSEVIKLCASELKVMANKIKSGEKIPDPILQLESAVIPTKRDKALSIIADLKNKHGFN
ncbi:MULTISPECIES: replication protein P [Providencia]|uniref:replication protein P n=1 Tax=Providencia TaxID=586 RepID=UPI0011CABFC2|nr:MULTISPECIES: replication protein P [Providencia]ELR5214509.1 DNA replication protein [Providencia rettgeri]TXM58143.1 DNA replication protein [Providencia rettgeri]TXM81025.1 DNA replication protein [Providencia rettgeri]HEM6865366.1 DNA replication protein [Providencia rettgeri]